ncbi:MAG: hypothetical protein LBU89_10475 [Fibromonadaceae bacterium]|jgi:hypothetical protein|nr:hypothetical protein [Fibromonadaceae bacterium]
MVKIKELLFRRFSLPAGLLALASVFVLSYFYYRLQADTPFSYEHIIYNISEYRVLDSRIYLFSEPGQINYAAARDNLIFQQSLIASIEELFYNLNNRNIKVPSPESIFEIKASVNLRTRWLESCLEGGTCNIEDWHKNQDRAWVASELLLTSFYNLLWDQEDTRSKNLRIFYILSVMLLLSTLFFAAKKK